MLRAGLLLLGAFSIGCTDPDESIPCLIVLQPNGYREPPSLPTTKTCIGASFFVARDSPSLTPTQTELDRYYNRWRRAGDAEPILAGRAPQRHRDAAFSFTLWTTNPAVIAAFNAAMENEPAPDVPCTGDEGFDQIMGELTKPQIDRAGSRVTDGSTYFELKLGAIYNEELLQTRLLPTNSHLEDFVQHKQDDATWTWLDSDLPTGTDEATALIDYTFGWGDCFSGCAGFHDLRVIAPPTGPVTVCDMGGEPLPPELQLSENTFSAGACPSAKLVSPQGDIADRPYDGTRDRARSPSH